MHHRKFNDDKCDDPWCPDCRYVPAGEVKHIKSRHYDDFVQFLEQTEIRFRFNEGSIDVHESTTLSDFGIWWQFMYDLQRRSDPKEMEELIARYPDIRYDDNL